MTMEATATTRRHARAPWRRTTWGELLSELLGTFVLICFGDGVVAMAVAALNQSGRGTEIFDASGDWLIIGWGWGFAVTFGVYVAGGISGAHINPAVTLAFAARRGFPWRKVPGYIAAQLVGAFLGAAARLHRLQGRDRLLRARAPHHARRPRLGRRRSPSSPPSRPNTSATGSVRSSTRSSAPRSSSRSSSRSSTSATSPSAGEPRAAAHRLRRRRHRPVLRRQRRLRHQPGARLRSAPVRLDRGVGQDRDAGRLRQRQRRTSGYRSSGRSSAASSAPSSTTSASATPYGPRRGPVAGRRSPRTHGPGATLRPAAAQITARRQQPRPHDGPWPRRGDGDRAHGRAVDLAPTVPPTAAARQVMPMMPTDRHRSWSAEANY